MTAPNSVYVYMSPLQQQIWDKNNNIPLAGGVVNFWSDPNFTMAKPIYIQSQTTPYGFTPGPAVLTLSIIGTFVNPNDGTNFIPFLYPFVGNPSDYDPTDPPMAQAYFIQVFDSNGNEQFTISDWPPNTGAVNNPMGFSTINVQAFETPGSTIYAPSTGTQWVLVRVLGGGGGGGGCAASGANQVTVGGAGGAGAYSEGFFDVATITGSAITVGVGGTAGAAGANAGTAGGISSIGSLITAPGGAGGAANKASAVAVNQNGAAGGAAGTGGYLNVPGDSGGQAIGLGCTSPSAGLLLTGIPGQTAYGSGGQSSTGPGAAGTGYGAGGDAGGSYNQSAASAGANGQPGLVIITEYSSS